jgi:prepilin-type N-terminal cleavage/methylation domain-containing protein
VKKLHPSMRPFRSGFTLLEVLFTVLIVAILAAVAVPLYSNSKTSSETTVCKSNIQAIATAESKYKFDNGAYTTATAATDLLNEGLAAWPACPTTGGVYTVTTSGTGVKVSCSIAAHAANSMTLP